MNVRFFLAALLLGVVSGTSACDDSEIALPKPPPHRIFRETDVEDAWINPGRNVFLNGGLVPGTDATTFGVMNRDTFAWSLSDDIWLHVHAPNASVRREGIGSRRETWYVYLRCAAPRSIPSDTIVQISFDACRPAPYEAGPGAEIFGYRIVAEQGFQQGGIEGGPFVHRSAEQALKSLDARIGQANIRLYRSIRDEKDWKNPKLVIRREGIEVIASGVSAPRIVSPADLKQALIALPLNGWPYGRVVAVSEIGIREPDRSDDKAIADNLQATLAILKGLNVTADRWPSA